MKIECNSDNQLTKLNLAVNNVEYEIPIHSHRLRNKLDKNNIGNILETYRQKFRDNDNPNDYFSKNKNVLLNYINRLKYPFNDWVPDYITIFYALDINRTSLLNLLFKKYSLNQEINYSDCFGKIDKTKSVTNDLNYYKNFYFVKPKFDSKPIKFLLIDDTINEGRTISAFIKKLYDNNLLLENTEIKATCLYTLPGKTRCNEF